MTSCPIYIATVLYDNIDNNMISQITEMQGKIDNFLKKQSWIFIYLKEQQLGSTWGRWEKASLFCKCKLKSSNIMCTVYTEFT